MGKLTASSTVIALPKAFKYIRWNASALIWPDDHIDVATFRKRLELFALNADDEEVTKLADFIQL